MSTHKSYKVAIIKALLLVVFVIAALLLVRFTPLRDWFAADKLGVVIDATGYWGPVLFVTIFAVGACLFVPYTALTTLGAVLFGVYWGFFYVWLGALAGASASFLIGRTLGRDFAAHLIGDRISRYNDAIEHNGFTTVVYLRLLYLPFAPLNFGLGLTKVRFWDYFFGTGLAFLVETWIFIFVIDALKVSWLTGSWEPLCSGKVAFAVGLFVFSLFIPKGIKLILDRPRTLGPAAIPVGVPESPDGAAKSRAPSNV
jgi:uncharacterized membrane protein YdjX (TVP38/TMEM64 family)